jgi:exonuclease III
VSTLRNQDLKLSAILGYKSDVILLSDVRLNGRDEKICDRLRLWYTVYHNSTKNSRGVAVLISKQVQHEVISSAADPQENILMLRIKINNVEFVAGAVYGPNTDNNCLEFFTFISNTLNQWQNIPYILGGDWNATYSCLPVGENPDVLFMRQLPSMARSRHVNDLCERYELTDPFRLLHPDVRDFTYNPSGTVRKNRSRIDFFLMSSELTASLNSCNIAQGYCSKTFDHKPIFLSLKKKRNKCRPIVHNGTVDHELSADVVKLAVHKTTLFSLDENIGPITARVLEEEWERMSNIENKINRIILIKGQRMLGELQPALEDELLDLEAGLLEDWEEAATLDYLQSFDKKVPADIFFENLLAGSRDALFGLQNALKAAEKESLRQWLSELANLKKGNVEECYDRIKVLESYLNNASEKLIKDKLSNFIKTDVLNSEKMTPLFLRLAQERNSSCLEEIKDDYGVPFPNSDARDRYIKNFYESLYKVPQNARVDFTNCIDNFLGDLVNHPAVTGCKLTEDERASLERGITVDELDEAVAKSNGNSAPGIDGIGNRFIKKFWHLFRIPLLEYLRVCNARGTLTETFRTALIRLIPKKGNVEQIKNWRPISLLSCFYKIISKAVDARLETVIDKVTSLAQKAYNKKRYIQEALINTIEMIRHCEVNGINGVILSVDQKKAFDSVFHPYMREVYRFFGFGNSFIRLLDTIGTNRTARIILDNGRNSAEFDLERGFAQGNSPSPKKYNIGEQILIFRIEYDPLVSGVYNNFLVPRSVAEGTISFPQWERAEEKGLVLDPELKETNRKASAFADDTNVGLLRTADNLLRVKNILVDFGSISGLETNVEKTTLMPIGGLDNPVPQEITDLGFSIVNEIKCLGLKLDNRAANLTDHFDEKIQKIRRLIGSWSRFNLSLPGRISIAKTMLLSQIGYIGCFITPTDIQLNTMQSLIDGYVKQDLVIAADRLHAKPNEGGLGLIRLASYVAALQCSWLKRCSVTINDTWRWNLASACNFNLDLVRLTDINPALYPATFCIVKSISSLQDSYWKLHENFLMAPVTDNCFFLREKPKRRARNAGILDRNFFGGDFYDQNKEALRELRLNKLIRNGRVIGHDLLIRTTGIPFNAAHYLNLQTACHFAVQKYGNKDGSNGTALPLNWLLQNVKKGSRKFRSVIDRTRERVSNIADLRVVNTFFNLAGTPVPVPSVLKILYGAWNWSFLGNRMRFFCFQFFNNSLGVGARLAARYENTGIVIDSRCSFCVKSKSWVPHRESFAHLFFDCQYIKRTVMEFASIMLKREINEDKSRLGCLTGIYDNTPGVDSFFYILTSIFLNYTIWQCKQRKTVPSLATLLNEVDSYFLNTTNVSNKITEMAKASNAPVCRRWREHGHGRG